MTLDHFTLLFVAFFATVFGSSCPATNSTNKKRVILDTDIGVDVDDTLALLLLLSHYPEIEIIAVHIVSVRSIISARMTKKYLTLSGHGNIPVYHGANKTFTNTTSLIDFDHIGDDVVYKEEYEYWDKYIIYNQVPSVELYNSADCVISVGQLTNIAKLFELDDKYHIKELILMGGSLVNDIYDGYELDAYSLQQDYNFRSDPDAVIRVLSSMDNIDSIVMITGNITLSCWLQYHDLLHLKQISKYQLPFIQIMIKQIEIWSPIQKDIFIEDISDDNVCFLHDALALSYVFGEDIWSNFLTMENIEIGFAKNVNNVLHTVNMNNLSKEWNNEKENAIIFKRNIAVSTNVNCKNFRKFFMDSVLKYQYPQLVRITDLISI